MNGKSVLLRKNYLITGIPILCYCIVGIVIGSIAVQELGGQINTNLFPSELKSDQRMANTVGQYFAMFAITGGWVLPIGLIAILYGFFEKVNKKHAIIIGMVLFVAVGIVYVPPMIFYHG